MACIANYPFALKLHPRLSLTFEEGEMTQAVKLTILKKDITVGQYKIGWTHWHMKGASVVT